MDEEEVEDSEETDVADVAVVAVDIEVAVLLELLELVKLDEDVSNELDVEDELLDALLSDALLSDIEVAVENEDKLECDDDDVAEVLVLTHCAYATVPIGSNNSTESSINIP